MIMGANGNGKTPLKTGETRRYRRLNLHLIKPSKYDDDGYVIRYWKGVLPSNTLACLYGLSEDVKNREVLGASLKWHIEAVDDTVEKVDVKRILRMSRDKDTKTVACLVGVQSNQFPRASDLAMALRAGGVDVLMGGFHVSGILATLAELTPELNALVDAGVTLVAGEAEGKWEMLLRDALEDSLRPVYNFLEDKPDISEAPMPRIPEKLLNRYAVQHFTTLDCGRGCPFQCTFCTVINVQGRKMRFRSVEKLICQVRENFRRHGIYNYFFTDDNLARNKNWEAMFDGLRELREKEIPNLSFMMQVDTQSHRIPDFIQKAKLAGCSQAFIGMESINEENLKAAGKLQNKIGDYRAMMDLYHEGGIATHIAYIIGFPFDTLESVKKDIQRLRSEIGAAQASFFMLTPLPGSEDYQYFMSNSIPTDADLNNFDSFHETFRHSRMKAGEWTRAYEEAWRSFYSVANMKNILRNAPGNKYWGVLQNFIWYKNAVEVEGGHPMLHGFFRLKSRRERRACYSMETRRAYFRRRAGDVWRTLTGWIKLALEMEEVWLATRRRNPLEEKVVLELSRVKLRVNGWRSLHSSELQSVYQRAALALGQSSNRMMASAGGVPSRFQLWLKKWDVIADPLTFSRFPMKYFWRNVQRLLKQGKVHRIRFHQVVFTFIREIMFFVRFVFSFVTQPGTTPQKQ